MECIIRDLRRSRSWTHRRVENDNVRNMGRSSRRRALLALGGLPLAYQATPATPKKLSAFDTQARDLLAKMTLDEKVGQMTQADQSALKDPADIERYFLGSVLSGGDSDPKAGNSREAWSNLYASIQAHSSKTRLRIPLLY